MYRTYSGHPWSSTTPQICWCLEHVCVCTTHRQQSWRIGHRNEQPQTIRVCNASSSSLRIERITSHMTRICTQKPSCHTPHSCRYAGDLYNAYRVCVIRFIVQDILMFSSRGGHQGRRLDDVVTLSQQNKQMCLNNLAHRWIICYVHTITIQFRHDCTLIKLLSTHHPLVWPFMQAHVSMCMAARIFRGGEFAVQMYVCTYVHVICVIRVREKFRRSVFAQNIVERITETDTNTSLHWQRRHMKIIKLQVDWLQVDPESGVGEKFIFRQRSSVHRRHNNFS